MNTTCLRVKVFIHAMSGRHVSHRVLVRDKMAKRKQKREERTKSSPASLPCVQTKVAGYENPLKALRFAGVLLQSGSPILRESELNRLIDQREAAAGRGKLTGHLIAPLNFEIERRAPATKPPPGVEAFFHRADAGVELVASRQRPDPSWRSPQWCPAPIPLSHF